MTDPTPASPEPRVQCPTCGKRFRVDRQAVAGRPEGAPARCSACGASFRVRATETGLEVLPDVTATRADSSPGRTGDGGRRKRRPPVRSAKRAAKRPPPRAPERKADAVLEGASIGLGDRVGRYEIDVLLDRGGMGAVYRAFDPAANREVALKVLSAGAPAEDHQRFRREVEVQGNIQHPHIMPIFDSGLLGRSRYFTMELLKDPLSLQALVDLCRTGRAAGDPQFRSVSTLEGLLRGVLMPVCQAVHHANVREGVLHRDVKPANVLIDRNGLRPFLIDFGVCSVLERKNTRLAHLMPDGPTLLEGGRRRVTGTLLYMPPEQARGNSDRRGDVWALGATLHHILTGEPPLEPATRGPVPTKERIEGLLMLAEEAHRQGARKEENEYRRKVAYLRQGTERTIEDLQRDVLDGVYLPRPDAPAGLDAIVAKAMSPHADRRYRHALDMHDDILAWLEHRPVRALLEGRGAVRRGLYQAGLAVRRHRKTAAVLLVAGALGTWAALGALGGAGGASDEVWSARVEGARVAAEQEVATQRLEEAEAQAERVREAFLAENDAVGRARLLVLSELLDSDSFPVLVEDPGRAERVERVHVIASGRRSLGLAQEADAPICSAWPMDPVSGCVSWDTVVVLGANGAPALSYGTWIIGAGDVVFWPLRVLPGEDPLVVEPPFAAGRVPEGRVWVGGVKPLFWDVTEVTVERYARFLDTLSEEERLRRQPRAPAPATEHGPGRPVEGISVEDAQAFAAFDGGRLPTSEEWTWAATGGRDAMCPLGSLKAVCSGGVCVGRSELHPREVGTTPADRTATGLFDMAGSVAEMTSTQATVQSTRGFLVMGGGYRTPLGRTLVREPVARAGDVPLPGVGFRLVYAVPGE